MYANINHVKYFLRLYFEYETNFNKGIPGARNEYNTYMYFNIFF